MLDTGHLRGDVSSWRDVTVSRLAYTVQKLSTAACSSARTDAYFSSRRPADPVLVAIDRCYDVGVAAPGQRGVRGRETVTSSSTAKSSIPSLRLDGAPVSEDGGAGSSYWSMLTRPR